MVAGMMTVTTAMANVYVLTENGIICVDYGICLKFMANKFKWKSIGYAEDMLKQYHFLLVGPDTITFKQGDIRMQDGLYSVTESTQIKFKDLCVISRKYWTEHVYLTYSNNEKDIG